MIHPPAAEINDILFNYRFFSIFHCSALFFAARLIYFSIAALSAAIEITNSSLRSPCL